MTYRTIGLEISDDVYQRAVSKAVGEGKTINQVLVELVQSYAAAATAPPAPPVSTQPAPSTAPATTSPLTTTPAQSIYVVKSGDTLGSISRRMYGSANRYFVIQKANNITDPRRIWVGQKLVIPPLDGETTTGAPAAATSSPAATPTVTVPPSIPVTVISAGANPPPPFRFVGSPNFNRRPRGEISAVIMHATANGSLERVIDWFNNPNAQVSAHYTIGKDGAIVQHVRDEHRAWHAGKSEWKGRPDLNSWSVGIELVNWNNGEDPFPEAQHQAALKLVAYLCSKYNVKPEFILAHYDIAPTRKTDPKGYDMDRLRREVAARL